MVAISVAFMFVILVLTDLAVQKWKRRDARQAERNPGLIASDALWNLPEGVHLSANHGWVKADPAGGLVTGADPLIVYAIGAISNIELPRVGTQVAVGQPLFRLVRDRHGITVPSSVSGKVDAVNYRLASDPNLLNSEPYGNGWVCRIIPSSAEASQLAMRFGERATMWLEAEFDRLRDFLSSQVQTEIPLGATSQDGGFPSPGCLGELRDAAWSAFEIEFLNQQ